MLDKTSCIYHLLLKVSIFELNSLFLLLTMLFQSTLFYSLNNMRIRKSRKLCLSYIFPAVCIRYMKGTVMDLRLLNMIQHKNKFTIDITISC